MIDVEARRIGILGIFRGNCSDQDEEEPQRWEDDSCLWVNKSLLSHQLIIPPYFV